jgi:hypothetical protein
VTGRCRAVYSVAALFGQEMVKSTPGLELVAPVMFDAVCCRIAALDEDGNRAVLRFHRVCSGCVRQVYRLK